MSKFSTASEAWRFLKAHHMFQDGDEGVLEKCLKIEVREINPETSGVLGESTKNTAECWFLKCSMWCKAKETGLGEPLIVPVPELDCDAPTLDEVVIKLANLVWDRYGNKVPETAPQ